MRTINKIVVAGTLLAGLAGLLGCSDLSESQKEYEERIKISQTSTDPVILEEYAQEYMTGHSHPAEFAYFRTLYFNNLKIIENNERILQEMGLGVDISNLLEKAAELQKYAQENMNGPSYLAKFKYLEAVSLTDKVIMQQQEALMKK